MSLPARSRVLTAQVPLDRTPSWLGVDRALAGWRAWQLSGSPVLVADAGTALSLTRIHANGAFAGGRLLAGAALQLRSLQAATAGLPGLELPLTVPVQPWPQATVEAMAAGVMRGLAAAVAQACCEARGEDPGCRLWITGGDGPMLASLVMELLGGSSLDVQLAPALALEALVELRPALDR
ncbi:MAG: type III pantothenate kinase [Cyanobium sp.]